MIFWSIKTGAEDACGLKKFVHTADCPSALSEYPRKRRRSIAGSQNHILFSPVKETTFGNLDISNVPDGVYVGEYDVDFVYAKVEVTVQNGVITNIDILEHKNGRGSRAEVVVDRIIEEQKIDVDAVSGATNSSIVIKVQAFG